MRPNSKFRKWLILCACLAAILYPLALFTFPRSEGYLVTKRKIMRGDFAEIPDATDVSLVFYRSMHMHEGLNTHGYYGEGEFTVKVATADGKTLTVWFSIHRMVDGEWAVTKSDPPLTDISRHAGEK